MAPKTRAMAAEKNKGKKKKQVSFTDDPSPFSPLQPSLPPSPFLQPSSTFTDNANPFSPLQLHLAVAAPPPIPSPLPLYPAASPPLIPSPLPLPSPSPSPF